jgi:hypothetical protein
MSYKNNSIIRWMTLFVTAGILRALNPALSKTYSDESVSALDKDLSCIEPEAELVDEQAPPRLHRSFTDVEANDFDVGRTIEDAIGEQTLRENADSTEGNARNQRKKQNDAA